MDPYSNEYEHLGEKFRLPNFPTTKMTLHTGQGNNSGPAGRGSMSILAHIVSRLIFGRAQPLSEGQLELPIFQITPLGMQILEKCAAHANGDKVRFTHLVSFQKLF